MLQSHDGSCPILDAFARKKAQQFAPFLNSLTEASEYAHDLSSSLWEFAMRLEHAQAMGVNYNDLLWMVKKGWIVCQTESGNGSVEDFLPEDSHEIRFVISPADAGIEGARVCGDISSRKISLAKFWKEGGLADSISPVWDADRRELLVCGIIVKRFRWPAPNQETILSVFSEENWPARIEDPLTQGCGLEPKRRLGDTIKCLNRNQQENLVRFRGDGTGEGVFWEIRS